MRRVCASNLTSHQSRRGKTATARVTAGGGGGGSRTQRGGCGIPDVSGGDPPRVRGVPLEKSGKLARHWDIAAHVHRGGGGVAEDG
jgi:hypothetical protein